MATISWVGLIIIALCAGFFAGRFITKQQLQNNDYEKQAEQAKAALAQYRQDVIDHIATTEKLALRINESQTQLVDHLVESKQLLTETKDVIEQPFFSMETTEQLAKARTQPRTRRDDTQLDAQPNDFAQGESGLFAGKSAKNNQATEA